MNANWKTSLTKSANLVEKKRQQYGILVSLETLQKPIATSIFLQTVAVGFASLALKKQDNSDISKRHFWNFKKLLLAKTDNRAFYFSLESLEKQTVDKAAFSCHWKP